jgi:hypothetical protein
MGAVDFGPRPWAPESLFFDTAMFADFSAHRTGASLRDEEAKKVRYESVEAGLGGHVIGLLTVQGG